MDDTANDAGTTEHSLRAELIERIDRSAHGKLKLKLRTLMDYFDYRAVQRLRQSSLDAVISQLMTWGIAATFPGGTTAADWITLSRSESLPREQTLAPQAHSISPAGDEPVVLDPQANPFAFVFDIADVTERQRSIAICHDIMAAVWSFRPVCLHIEASDEFFSFAAGYLSAVLRRRTSMAHRKLEWHLADYLAPQVLSLVELKQLLAPGHEYRFPQRGHVYLVHDVPQDVLDDELIAALRERCIPHTYRLKARFATTTANAEPGRRAVDDEVFPHVVQWLHAFAGAPSLESGTGGRFIDLANLLADAVQAGDLLYRAATHRAGDRSFRAGFESGEHMALKHSLLRYVRGRYPGETVTVESILPTVDDDDEIDGNSQQLDGAERRARPDLCVGSRIAIEIETLRGIARPDTDAFVALESKLRQKLRPLSQVEEAWLVVPSDVAMLAAEHLDRLIRNLDHPEHRPRMRLAYVDLQHDRPVFIRHEPLPRGAPVIRGASWRESRKSLPEHRRTWQDVAGYSGLQRRLREDVLAPLRDPEKYARHGIGAPNGLLLYGLPGCGKSLVGRVLAGEADLACRLIAPSDLTSMYIGEGVLKIRELFDWALKQAPCLLVIDEVDGIAPQRTEHNMHSDTKREVNELLAQLDRIADKRVAVVATTNYVDGIDAAIRRSGRFDVKIPVFPPNPEDRSKIFAHYLSAIRLPGVDGLDAIDSAALAQKTPLFTPADIKAVVETALRRAIHRAGDDRPQLGMLQLLEVLHHHQRAIHPDAALHWVASTRADLGVNDLALLQLEDEVRQVRGE
ncbi:ATP-binding protein [Nannocystis sp. SCPEA4]|uniref:ATP-binding protein n=1 Tax=Nannocystis sp. SCPEA4 TaxID=2996787 RepID=UPI00226EB695|nr:ATP-binding protein [Nannocystis sp. SCPEA4]MCY1061458.1 ATP-binding protein [Nannocystis sp. SCPEA4]